MKAVVFAVLVFLLFQHWSIAQSKRENIYTDFVLYQKRVRFEKDVRENVIVKTFSQTLDSNNEDRFESACKAATQFMIVSNEVEDGLAKMFSQYEYLQYETKKALLEAVYGLYPDKYIENMQAVFQFETHPKLFAMSAVYLYRNDTSINNSNDIKIRMVEQFPGYDTLDILIALEHYLNHHHKLIRQKTPDIAQLFSHQQTHGKKIIYSFQRWNRDYPGIAIVQNADGRFVRDANGRLLIFQQLARSASDLPYFISNGNTPQGIYSIQGTGRANNLLIGPTPNLQLIMPHEKTWEKFFHQPIDSTLDSLQLYQQLLPEKWKKYQPINEAWDAGKIGRTEIIAHGTTLDPEYFKDKPYYPLTPTMGCLCAKEIWNVTTGRLQQSEQFNLVSAFQLTTGNKGYLFVINVDDQQKPVSRIEVESWVKKCEAEQ